MPFLVAVVFPDRDIFGRTNRSFEPYDSMVQLTVLPKFPKSQMTKAESGTITMFWTSEGFKSNNLSVIFFYLDDALGIW